MMEPFSLFFTISDAEMLSRFLLSLSRILKFSKVELSPAKGRAGYGAKTIWYFPIFLVVPKKWPNINCEWLHSFKHTKRSTIKTKTYSRYNFFCIDIKAVCQKDCITLFLIHCFLWFLTNFFNWLWNVELCWLNITFCTIGNYANMQ